jgi:hypothetical protein
MSLEVPSPQLNMYRVPPNSRRIHGSVSCEVALRTRTLNVVGGGRLGAWVCAITGELELEVPTWRERKECALLSGLREPL